MVENPPASGGDTGSIPGLRIFHMPQSSSACPATAGPEGQDRWSLGALEPVLCNKRSQCSEKPTHHN